MSFKHRSIQRMVEEGKSYPEICHTLNITPPDLRTTVYRMRKKGMVVSPGCNTTKGPALSPRQRQVLDLYAEYKSPIEIAKILGISWQAVEAHANEGFKRHGLITPGIDRIAALRVILGLD